MSTTTSFSFTAALAKSGLEFDSNKQGAEAFSPFVIGMGLALVSLGWRTSAGQGNGWTEMTHASAARHAVHTGGEVRIEVGKRGSRDWRTSTQQNEARLVSETKPNVYCDDVSSHMLYVGHPAYYREALSGYVAMSATRFGETQYMYHFCNSAAPLEITALVHGPRPGAWQAAVELNGEAKFWFACSDDAAKREMAEGFYAFLGQSVPEGEFPAPAAAPAKRKRASKAKAEVVTPIRIEHVANGSRQWWWILGTVTAEQEKEFNLLGCKKTKDGRWYFQGDVLSHKIRNLGPITEKNAKAAPSLPVKAEGAAKVSSVDRIKSLAGIMNDEGDDALNRAYAEATEKTGKPATEAELIAILGLMLETMPQI